MEDANGVLWFCRPNVVDLKELILKEDHDTPYFIHAERSKKFHDLKDIFWWKSKLSTTMDFKSTRVEMEGSRYGFYHRTSAV
jgi:hypothetical protein